MRWPPRRRAFLVCLLPFIALLPALIAPPAPLAAQKALRFEEFDARVEVQPSGDLIVTETLRPRFTGEWNGITRRIRLLHTTAAGDRARLEIELLSASDERGGPLRTDQEKLGRDLLQLKVWVPDARDRTASVVLRYRVRGAIRYFAGTPPGDGTAEAEGAGLERDYDELYWQVTGTEGEVPLESVRARVALPPGAEVLRAAAYRGDATSTAAAPVEIHSGGPAQGREGGYVVADGGSLRPGEGLTVAVAWPAGHVARPAALARGRPVQFGRGSVLPADEAPGISIRSAGYRALLPLLLPFLVFWLAYRVWDRRGRDPRERAIAVRWEPPTDLDPAEAGTLVDHDPGMRDIVSILVDLAVRGYVVIAERKKPGLLRSRTDYAFHLVRPSTEWGELARHERLFLNGLFTGSGKSEVLANLAPEGSLLDGVLEAVAGEPASSSAPDDALESVLLSDLQDRFYKKIPAIKDALLDGLVGKGYYLRRPDRVRVLWGALAVATLALGVAAAAVLTAASANGAVFGATTLAAAAISALIIAIFAWIMPARTRRGARAREVALGFKRFLERVESPRYRRMITGPEQFERYLPYALAFRCADRWANAFDDLVSAPPEWYHGRQGAFRPSVFASDLGTLASTASSTLASSPSSSSGSGGGGSVGGGSGGGGTGGF